MDNVWNIDNIRLLFSLASEADERGESLAAVFNKTAEKVGCGAGSVRNYYYSQARLFKMIPSLAREMGVKAVETRAKPFVVFGADEAKTLLCKALCGKADGVSVRKTFLSLAAGDEKIALRYQNKYRSLLAHHKQLVSEVMDELAANNVRFYNPFLHCVSSGKSDSRLKSVLDKVDALSGEERELLLRKILLS